MVVENREKVIRINLTRLGQAAGLVVHRAFQLGQSGLSVGGEPGGPLKRTGNFFYMRRKSLWEVWAL